MPQPIDYHAFVDDRTLWGVPHFKNVVSNLAFVLAGAAGFAVMARSPAAKGRSARITSAMCAVTSRAVASGPRSRSRC